MHDQDKGASRARVTTYDEDARERASVLREVLSIYPETMTLDELVCLFSGGGSKEFSDRERIQRAVRELASGGLLHRPGDDEVVRPTRAAVNYFHMVGEV
jgi:hypothetical protein